MVNVINQRCPQDHKCPLIYICPQHAIEQKEFHAPLIDKEKCINCNLCVHNCPYHAVIH